MATTSSYFLIASSYFSATYSSLARFMVMRAFSLWQPTPGRRTHPSMTSPIHRFNAVPREPESRAILGPARLGSAPPTFRRNREKPEGFRCLGARNGSLTGGSSYLETALAGIGPKSSAADEPLWPAAVAPASSRASGPRCTRGFRTEEMLGSL